MSVNHNTFSFELPTKVNFSLNQYKTELNKNETFDMIKAISNDIINSSLLQLLASTFHICSNDTSLHYTTEPKQLIPNQISQQYQYGFTPLMKSNDNKDKISSIEDCSSFMIECAYQKKKDLNNNVSQRIIKQISLMINGIERNEIEIKKEENNKSSLSNEAVNGDNNNHNNHHPSEAPINVNNMNIIPKDYDEENIVEPHKKNLLLDYLPCIPTNNTIDDNISLNYNCKGGNQILLYETQFENIKTDLAELYPLLKKNHRLREQFFINLSEGKEEKYVFFKNLYEIINESNTGGIGNSRNQKSPFKISNYSLKAKNVNYKTNINFFTNVNPQNTTMNNTNTSSFVKGKLNPGIHYKLKTKQGNAPPYNNLYGLYQNNKPQHKNQLSSVFGSAIKHNHNNSYSFIKHNNYL